mmetsp:Transcript_74917/g.231656  ORF Transcript_74917/g.231656 Transcript_74917/m.231656 type:complete len:295 (-) Transcript_74917:300-1184(-)
MPWARWRPSYARADADTRRLSRTPSYERTNLSTGPRNSAASLFIGQWLRHARSADSIATCRGGNHWALTGSSSWGPTPSSTAGPHRCRSNSNCAKPMSCPAEKAWRARCTNRCSRSKGSIGAPPAASARKDAARLRTSGRGARLIHTTRHEDVASAAFGRISPSRTRRSATSWHRAKTSNRPRLWNASLPILSSNARAGLCQLVGSAEQLFGQASVSVQKSLPGNTSSIFRCKASACPARSRSASAAAPTSSAMRVRKARRSLLPSRDRTPLTRRARRPTSISPMCRTSRNSSL